MSLIVTLRVPDGIVVASDSMSTAHHLVEPVLEGMQCPSCKYDFKSGDLRTMPYPIPISASSYTQKLFPLLGKFGLGTFGLAVINDKSYNYHIRQFEENYRKDLRKNNKTHEKMTIHDIKDNLIKYFESELNKWDVFKSPETPTDWHPVEFHLSGYDFTDIGPNMLTYQVKIGKNNQIKPIDKIGCTIGGYPHVVVKLWAVGEEDAAQKFKYSLYSLQDAIDLAEYLISTTSNFQRFANTVPTVGGEIDIALITPFSGFQWIKRKKLMKVLEAKND